MAISIPDDPRFVTVSEREVWHHLIKQLPGDCLVLANFRISDAHKDHEADFVVLMPGSGVVSVEVKGSHVWVEPDGRWMIRRDAGDQEIHPVEQARGCAYALRDYLTRDPRWSRSRVRWSHHVVLARTRLDACFATPECPRWQITGADQLSELGQRIWDTTSIHRTDARLPNADDIELIREILTGRNLPRVDPTAMAEDRAELADRLTQEQAAILGVTRLLHRLEIRGGAGSGKTVLALRQAADLASGRASGTKQRVAVLCYSYGLAHHLRRTLLVGSTTKRPAFVGNLEDLARHWGIVVAEDREDSDYWEAKLPAQLAQVVAGLSQAERFDAIVVDEAQDFADHWWTPIVGALRDEVTSGLYTYRDDGQGVFGRDGHPPLALIPLVLDHNLRNTRQIADAFAPLVSGTMHCRGGEGPAVEFIAATADSAIKVADDQVERLFDEGWQARDITLLTTGLRHPVQVERQESAGFSGYWEAFGSNDDVFYSHVLGFKGLERRAVVLCVNEDGSRPHARERLYVGLSRATDRLIVVGDPEAIARIGGAGLLERLRGGSGRR